MKKLTTYFLFLFLVIANCSAQFGNAIVESKYAHLDNNKYLILINQDLEDLNDLYSGLISSIEIDDQIFSLEQTIDNFELGTAYQVTTPENNSYKLYFTELPIVNINTDNIIVDEPRVLAQFSMTESNGEETAQDMGIEYRGGSSQNQPKKSYRLEFWKDPSGEENQNLSLLNMRDDDDWNLQAMYNEPLRIRSKLNFELWDKIDTLSYLDIEPNASNHVKQEYVEVFINDEYNGLYCLSERIDRKQLKLNKFEEGEIKGELYKGISWEDAALFDGLPLYDDSNEYWAGFRYEYPSEKIDWSNIYDLVDFVVNEDSVSFYEDYQEKFDIDNAVNYFIFLNLIRALDNTGKNIFIAKRDVDQAYFYVPWDLDGTFGIFWDGSQTMYTGGILSNGFYNKMIFDQEENGFFDQLRKRWNHLREEIITHENILGEFKKQFQFLDSNGVYDREKMVWEECEFLDINNIEFTDNWLVERINFLDEAFNNHELLSKDIMINFGEGNDAPDNNEESIKLSPNPASEMIEVKITPGYCAINKLYLFNSTGQLLLEKIIDDLQTEIDISNFANGVHFARIEYCDGSRKLVKFIILK